MLISATYTGHVLKLFFQRVIQKYTEFANFDSHCYIFLLLQHFSTKLCNFAGYNFGGKSTKQSDFSLFLLFVRRFGYCFSVFLRSLCIVTVWLVLNAEQCLLYRGFHLCDSMSINNLFAVCVIIILLRASI